MFQHLLTPHPRPARAIVLVAAVLVAGSTMGGVDRIASATPATPAAPTVTLTNLASASNPVDLAWREGDDALYIVQQGGVVLSLVGDTATPVFDVSDLVVTGGEQGLLGLVFTPAGDVAYLDYTDVSGDTQLVEVPVSADGVFDRDAMRTVMSIDQPEANHNGGDLAFGPDGMLYFGLGDGGGGGDPSRNAQNMSVLLGKILRIDPTPSGDLGYTVPADNPFVGVDETRPEIWASGLRNPWRWSFDADTGDLWIADVGQSAIEEIDFAPATDGLNAGRGLDFGWSAYEGTEVYNDDQSADDRTDPIYQYPHDPRCSITGGERARGEGAGALSGWYVFSDYCTSEIYGLAVTGDGVNTTVEGDPVVLATGTRPAAIRSGPDGTLYVLDDTGINRVDVG